MHRHGVQRVAHSLGLVAVVQFLLGDFGGIAAGTTQMITMAETNDYSRDAEREADATGTKMMHLAGGDPHALATFFHRLSEEYGELPMYMNWLSTHPTHEERISNVEAIVTDLSTVPRRDWTTDWSTDWQSVRASLIDEEIIDTVTEITE